MKPLVTIAVPTLERLHYLKEAVASALAQSYLNVEIIIGDDGKEEAIKTWGTSIAADEPRVKYQRNGRRLGLAGNWNALADAARGEFIAIIGDDDRLLPHFVESLLEAALPDADVAFSNHYIIDGDGRRLAAESERCTRMYRRHTIPSGEVGNAAAAVWQNSVPMSAALIRTEYVRRLRFKEDLNTPELELFARMAHEGARFVFVPEYLAEYRSHSRSATSAGLRSERLVKYLTEIPVGADVEPYKRELMSALLVDAVSRCLRRNERGLARQFLRHEYYPRPRLQKARRNGDARLSSAAPDRHSSARFLRDALRGYAQELCAMLPAPFGCRAYRLAQSVGRVHQRR
ncbi:MAG TPA: glycosyltransferase family 2 protein [Pyrinomonadaceae bacterium]|nr:glycosyltransferase family 2 protein [Pyrinomonadaceae bacterium]